MKVMQAIGLSRVSTKDQQEGFSLTAQTNLVKEYSQRNKFNLVETVEMAETASGERIRKRFRQLIERLNKDGSITELVVEKTDRVTRNLADLVAVNNWLQKKEENHLHLVKENLVISKNSKSTETFIWSIKASVADFYSKNLGEEVRKGMNQKAAEGWFPNNRKVGYKLVLKEDRKVWEINPDEAIFVKQAFSFYISGLSIKETVTRLFDAGFRQNGKPIAKNHLWKILKDPFYIGKFNWRGQIYEGKQQPLVSPDVFYRTQELLEGKSHARTKKHIFSYGKGLIKCPTCDHSLVGELQRGQVYYRCHSCEKQKYLKEDVIGTEIIQHLKKFEIKSPRLADWIKDALKAYRGEELLFTNNVLKTLTDQLEQVNTRRSKLYDDHADGKVDEGFYEVKMAEYNAQVKDLEKGIAKNERNEELSIKLAHSIFELALRAKSLYLKRFTPEKKWQFLKLASSNITNKGDYLDITYKNGFEVLFKRPKLQIGSGAGIRTPIFRSRV